MDSVKDEFNEKEVTLELNERLDQKDLQVHTKNITVVFQLFLNHKV